MGKQAKLKAERKAARAAQRQARSLEAMKLATPQYIPTSNVPKQVSRSLQKKRDLALVRAKREYERVQQAIRHQYWLDISGQSKTT